MSNLVFLDLETGGLNDEKLALTEPLILPTGQVITHINGSQFLPILEIAILIVDDKTLDIVDEYTSEVRQNKNITSVMNSWSLAQHTNSGLMERCFSSKKSLKKVEQESIDFLKKHNINPKESPMCGNSIHFDRDFIVCQMNDFYKMFSHRNIDVSSFMERTKRTNPNMHEEIMRRKGDVPHLALEDIKLTLNMAKNYDLLLFKKDIAEKLNSDNEIIKTKKIKI